ncbi:MAG: hypothetical protein SFY92_00770 [Verrucomicrobiae bacterium]|nr:hypothetical protein [Verrucomicrobiae bacterium]
MLSKGGNIVFKILFLLGAIAVAGSGFYMSSDREKAKFGLLIGLMVAAAPAIMEAYYDIGGLSGSKVKIE